MKYTEKVQVLKALEWNDDDIQDFLKIDQEDLNQLIQTALKQNHQLKKLQIEQSRIWLRITNEVKTAAIKFIEVRHKTDYHGQYIFLALVSLVLAAVLILALSGKIEQNTVGNIISSVVGFSIGKFTEKSSS
jgi:hypothetical protein